MRKHLSALVAVLAAVIGILGVSAPTASAATVKWNPKAAMSGSKFCQNGVTKQRIVFTNPNARRRVQFNLRRINDAFAPTESSFYVRPGQRVVKYVSVEFGETASARVRSPEYKRPNELLISAVIQALPDCRRIIRAPRATLGGTTCIGKDSVVTVGLDNRRTTDVSVRYETVATQADSTTTDVTTVPQETLMNTYVIARSGQNPVHIEVRDVKTGDLLLARDVPARSC